MPGRTEHGDLRYREGCRCEVCTKAHAKRLRDYRRRRAGASQAEAERLALVDEWRERAARLDDYATVCRRCGDTAEARDAEEAAADYRTAADELEFGGAA